MNDIQKEKLLQKAFEDYKSGLIGNKTLRREAIKNRVKFINRLTNFLGGKPFNEQTAREFVSFISTTQMGKPSKASTIATYVGKMRALCEFLIEERIIENNFCKKIPRPTEEQAQNPIKPIDPEIIERAIRIGTTSTKYDRGRSRQVKEDSRVALLFALLTARRRSEILGLKGEDLNLNDSPPTYWVTLKGGRKQLFEIPPVKELLSELMKRKDREVIFPISGEVMIKHLNDGLRKLGIKTRMKVHDLRDVFTLERLRRGEPVSRLLGHRKIETTIQHYAPYVVTDYSSTLRNSSMIQHGLSIQEIVEDIHKEITAKTKDDRFQSAQIKMDNGGFYIKVPYSNVGVKEIQKARK